MVRILSEIKSKRSQSKREKERLANQYAKAESSEENGSCMIYHMAYLYNIEIYFL